MVLLLYTFIFVFLNLLIPVHLCNMRIATSSIFSSGRKDVFFYFIILQNVKFRVRKKIIIVFASHFNCIYSVTSVKH